MGILLRRAGRRLTGLVVIIGFIMLIPGIILISLSSTIYGDPITETGKVLGTTMGSSNSIGLEGLMTAGNNYAIHIEITVFATPANPPNSNVTIRMTITKIGADLATLPPTYDFQQANFNSTIMSKTYDFKDDFVASASANFSFEIIDSLSLTSAYIEVLLYENPRRVLANVAMTVGLILLIPGGFILIIVACLTSRRRR